MRRGAAGRHGPRRRGAGGLGRRASRPGPRAAADDGGRHAHRPRRAPGATRARAGARRGGRPRRHGRRSRLEPVVLHRRRLGALRAVPGDGPRPHGRARLGRPGVREGPRARADPRGNGRAVLAGGRVALRARGAGARRSRGLDGAHRHRGDPSLRVLATASVRPCPRRGWRAPPRSAPGAGW